MRFSIKTSLAIAATGLTVAVPAAALAGPPSGHGNGNHPHAGDHPNAGGVSHSHGCLPHNRAYVEGGTVNATQTSTMSLQSDGTWSGTLYVDVKHANRAAKADRNQTVSWNLANVRVRFDGGATAFAAGERVQLIGKIQAAGKKCTASSSTTPAVPTFRLIVVHPGPAA